MLNCSANSASVLSPLTAAKATCALKVAVSFGSLPRSFSAPPGGLQKARLPLITLSEFLEPPLRLV